MTTPTIIPCQERRCRWLRDPKGPLDDPVFVCYAFPTGIPQEILDGKNDHTEPYPGDDGFLYQAEE